MKTVNKYSSGHSFYIIVLLSVLLLTVSCTKMNNTPTGPSGVPAGEVYIQGNAFSPATLTVDVNTTVKWTNKDGISHTVTSDSPLFDSGSMSAGAPFSFQFTSTGTFNYHCAFHPSMTAKVIVK